MRTLLAGYPETLFTDTLHRSSEAADLYALELALDLLRSWDVERALATPAGPAALGSRLGFAASFVPAIDWLLARAAAAGALGAGDGEDGTVYSAARLPHPRRLELRELALELDPRNAATLDLLDAAAAAYPVVAAGGSGETTLFGPSTVELWARYFDNGNPVYAVNNRVAAKSACDRLPPGRASRILEIGAGGGSASQALIEEIAGTAPAAERLAAFRVTEPSAFLRRRAERVLRGRWPALPIAAAALDIDGDWPGQGVADGTLDLVYGVNVLHVARNLHSSLRSAWRALGPGGWLVMGECIRPRPGQPLWPEFIFRLLDGFNRVETDPELRPSAGFLTPEQWLHALTAAGFSEASIEPDPIAIRELYPRFLTGALCARRAVASDCL